MMFSMAIFFEIFRQLNLRRAFTLPVYAILKTEQQSLLVQRLSRRQLRHCHCQPYEPLQSILYPNRSMNVSFTGDLTSLLNISRVSVNTLAPFSS